MGGSRVHKADGTLARELLALPSSGRRVEFLREAGLLNAEGLDRLLDVADRLLTDDPGKSRELAALCREVAPMAGAPAAVPRADYIRAGTHGINGEFDAELRLIKAAHDGYLALGMNLEALRTNVGRMAVLLELGLYQEALDAGGVVLNALEGRGDYRVRPTQHQRDLLTALVHQNRGGCLEYMGRYDGALEACAIAEEHYRALGMTERAGEVSSNRGAILSQLGRGSEALAAHEAAATVFADSGLTLYHAKALSNIGEAHLRLTNYACGLEAFERARLLYDSLDALADKNLLLLDTANAYLELNLYSEALAAYEEADASLRITGMAHDRAQALRGMGSALIASSQLERAERALAGAAELFAAAENAPLLSGVMLEQAALLEASGEPELAAAKARRALALVSDSDRPVQRFFAHLRLADLLLPDVSEVEPHLRAARRLAKRLALPHLRFRLNERLGRLRRLQGRDEEARALLQAAVGEIERLRGSVAHEPARASFMGDKTAAYEELLRLHLAREDEQGTRDALAVAEQAKSRALADLISGVADRGASARPGVPEEIQTLQADLNATYNLLLDEDDGGRDDSLTALRARATELESEISRRRLRFAGASPDPFSAASPRETHHFEPPPEDTTLLAYHVVGDEILSFVVSASGMEVVRYVGSASAVARLLRRLNARWGRFRAEGRFAQRHARRLQDSAQGVLAALYNELVAPLQAHLDGAPEKLALVPHGPLHQVPFHALFDGERYLIERFEVSYAPSARIYSLCQNRPPSRLDRALVVSVPDELIPAVAGEARAVAQRLPGAETLGGEAATVAAVRERAPGSGVLHLACHGMFRSDNPMFSALKLHDGWLLAADAMGLDLGGALVTLSACESGRSRVLGGDELIGLTRAFLGAGAATLVSSLWLVQDETTARLMGDWYGRIRGGAGPAAALRQAQLAVKEAYPHPYYWAPFVLIGRR